MEIVKKIELKLTGTEKLALWRAQAILRELGEKDGSCELADHLLFPLVNCDFIDLSEFLYKITEFATTEVESNNLLEFVPRIE